MTSAIKSAPLLAALIAFPAFAQPADPHAGHHPDGATAAAPAKPDAKADDAQGCPMMKGGQATAGPTKGADGKAAPGQMAMNGMMKGDHMQRCMAMADKTPATPAAKPGAPEPR